jgi:hypothetical protein
VLLILDADGAGEITVAVQKQKELHILSVCL